MLQYARLLTLVALIHRSASVVVAAEQQLPITGADATHSLVEGHRTLGDIEAIPAIETISFSQTPVAAAPIQPKEPSSNMKALQPDSESEVEPSLPWLITSPYTSEEHLTNLSTLPMPSRLLTLALAHLTAKDTRYATTPYSDALNWPTVFSQLKVISDLHNHSWNKTSFYVVEFRSRLKQDIDRDLLFKLDRESHREATASGGLLKYWFGRTSDDAEGRNLATCLWREKADAVAGGKGPWHKKARGSIPKMYASIEVKGLKLTIENEVADWKFEPWVEDH